MNLPKFHETNEEENSDFFALAYMDGRYISPGGRTNVPAFYVLYSTTSKDYTSFVTMAIDKENETCTWYTRGDDHLNTLEYILLKRSELEGIPIARWLLYPREEVKDPDFDDENSRQTYWKARRRLCLILYPQRVIKSRGELDWPNRMFVPAGNVPDSKSQDFKEIWETSINIGENGL